MQAGTEQGYVGSETQGVVEEPLQFLMKLDAKQRVVARTDSFGCGPETEVT